ncbi:MAG: BsaA family SipW-dependent biofilm matrix protein [Lachnospiraceae bacterium]|nr:BsaA family SipW-dependent biofilm matrix protein [Lachnospiraceae bacterium]
MKILKKSKVALLMFALFLAVSVAGVWAYFGEEMVAENPFYTVRPEISIVEIFDPSDNWVPGEEKQKEVQFQNDGNLDMLMRFTVEKTVYGPADDKGNREKLDSIPTQPGSTNSLFEVQFDQAYLDANFASQTGNDGITWYYYKKVLGKESATDFVIKSIKIADWAGNDYQDYELHAVVKAEMVQYDETPIAAEETGWPSYEVSGEAVTWAFE